MNDEATEIHTLSVNSFYVIGLEIHNLIGAWTRYDYSVCHILQLWIYIQNQ